MRLDDLHDWYSRQLQEILAKSKTNKDEILTEMRQDFVELGETQSRTIDKSRSNLHELKTKLELKKNEQQTTVYTNNVYHETPNSSCSLSFDYSFQLLLKMVKLEEKYAKEIETTRQECNSILKDYHNNTETKRAHYRILSEQDDSNSLQINRHFEEIIHYSKRIENAKIELDEMRENNRKEIEKINDEKENVRNELLQMQRQCTQNSAADREQLKFMVHVSNQVIQVTHLFTKDHTENHLI